MKRLQIGRRRLDRWYTGARGKRLSDTRRKVQQGSGNYGQIYVKIDCLLMLKRNLFAVGPGLGRLALLCFALAVCLAAAFGARPHEKLFAGDASTPKNGGEQQQRKKRT